MISRFFRAVSVLALGITAAAACASSTDAGDDESGDSNDSAIVINNPTLTSSTANGTIDPPAADAVQVTPHTPLRSGDGVSKKRWLWLPPGTKIAINASGGVDVPVGTTLWKEFYAKVGTRDILIERRRVKKTKDTGDLDDWEFKTAHKGVAGEERAVGGVVTDMRDLGAFALDPAKPAPIDTFKYETTIRVNGDAKFVFPGDRLCTSCHSGISTMYPGGSAVAAFSIQPASLTKESRAALVAKGYIDDATVAKLAESAPKFDEMNPTRKLLAEMRSNCMTCHSNSPDSYGNLTDFKLDAKKDYTDAELVQVFSQRSFENSTLLENIPLHLQGKRSFMPPPVGGVPALTGGRVDPERTAILQTFNAWKTAAHAQ